eukprot:CAMPEP_0174712264 /NCGR_PEP_ID=MMETSP1094-20130205/13325_1 /TAXON_ID=156173 /ORGANISM="Chrysochromulina brevifilum, Strain UTEX LB 985" /LENGTH=102 /DNA_ID=CAMNT_0015911321 /DNA_START=58 /DNA_END=366 /DNA_ORIENTATION=+
MVESVCVGARAESFPVDVDTRILGNDELARCGSMRSAAHGEKDAQLLTVKWEVLTLHDLKEMTSVSLNDRNVSIGRHVRVIVHRCNHLDKVFDAKTIGKPLS